MKSTINIFFNLLLLSFLSVILLFSACKKEDDFIDDSSAKLSFSADSLLFDTVFTTLGSVTKQIKIYNTNNKSIRISSIKLGNGQNSMFRINIDGNPSYQLDNVEIAANDSMYIFVKLTINPNNQNNPLIVTDSIIFTTNGNIQDVNLVAWGQDAYYHVPNKKIIFSDGSFLQYSFAGCNLPWPNDKPHVIYGYCVVDSDSTLIIQEGTKIHLAPNAVLWVLDQATLKVNGTLNNKVFFQGSRLDSYYKNLPGQWGKIWLSRLSKDNEINYAVIKNGSIGIQVDTVANLNPTLKLDNTIIENMSVAGIFAQGSKIVATNAVITNCGQYAVVLSIGGYYEFLHSTIGNYWDYNLRQTPSLVLNNYYKDLNEVVHYRPLLKAYFGNCIIYGNNEEEILLDGNPNSTFNFEFDHCLLKTKNNSSNINNYKNCLINQNPQFKNTEINNLNLMQNSPSIANGSVNIGILVPLDLNGNIRPQIPSLGAYEFVPSIP